MARVTIVPTGSHHDATDTAGLYRGEREKREDCMSWRTLWGAVCLWKRKTSSVSTLFI